MTYPNSIRTFSWACMCVLAGACFIVGMDAVATTTSVTGDSSGSSADQPGITTPIYSNIPATGAPGVPQNHGDGPAAEQLLVTFMDQHSAMNYAAAVETAMRLVQVAPDRPHGHYNLACALSRLRRMDDAVASLDTAIDAGWRDLRHMSMDPDLAAVRASGGYGRVVEKLIVLTEQERVQPTALRSDEWPVVSAEISSKAPALFANHHVETASLALIHDGKLVWSGNYSNGVVAERHSAASDARYRIRRPIELIGLLAGAQLQQQGRLELARIIEEGAELDRSLRSRTGAARREQPPTLTITPVGQRERGSQDNVLAPAGIDPNDPTMSLLRLSVEIVSGQPFADYCQANIIDPMAMASTSFARPNGEVAAVILGHTVLGTPVPVANLLDGPTESSVIYTTAADLARLVESLAGPTETATSTEANPINLLARINAMSPTNRAGDSRLSVQVRTFDTGRRVQVFEITDGVGCLIRWHSRTRNGIVILFDSATGGEAAVRIAHLALGGE